jgi:hypothetical protein
VCDEENKIITKKALPYKRKCVHRSIMQRLVGQREKKIGGF